jgi:hypothetical protein
MSDMKHRQCSDSANSDAPKSISAREHKPDSIKPSSNVPAKGISNGSK